MRIKNIKTMKRLALLLIALPIATCGKDGGSEGFSGFEEPQIVVVNHAPGSEGGAEFTRLVPDARQFVLDHVRAVVQTLYATGAEANRAGVKKINLQITPDYEGLAAKFGNTPEITIKYGTEALAVLVSKNDATALAEIRGVIDHELTHAYQSQPRGAGVYDGRSEHWAFIEGVADAVRPMLEPFSDGRKPRPGGERQWLTGYSTTGFFLKWLAETKDPEFLRKFNATGWTIAPWSWDAALKSIFGATTTRQLWDEYQASLE